MGEPQPFTDDELAQARNAPLGWTARRWLATVDQRDAEVRYLRHALTNVADNLHGAGLISDVAKADILRSAAGVGDTHRLGGRGPESSHRRSHPRSSRRAIREIGGGVGDTHRR